MPPFKYLYVLQVSGRFDCGGFQWKGLGIVRSGRQGLTGVTRRGLVRELLYIG